MSFVAYTAAPFVTYVHIRLPNLTIRSRDQLQRWVQRIPPTTEVDLTTMGFTGLPRVSRMAFSELRHSNARFGIANLIRVPSSLPNSSRPWWRSKEPQSFFVSSERLKSRPIALWQTIDWKKAMWQQILDQVRR